MKKLINWKLFFILLVVCIITSLMVLPYALSLTSPAELIEDSVIESELYTDAELLDEELIEEDFLAVEDDSLEDEIIAETEAEIVITPFLIVISTIINNLILFGIAIFLGLLLSKKIGQEKGGFRLPIIEGILNKENKSKEFKALLLPSIGLGVIAGVLIILLSIPFNKAIPEFLNMDPIPAWQGFLASFYGGIAEEVLLRLFVVTLFVWITFKIKKTSDGKPTDFGIWLSIVLAAILFGLGHLPATAQIVPLSGLVIFRAILLNGIAGVICGWLYWKKGLESAILAHFSADIVLHVITPIVVSLFL